MQVLKLYFPDKRIQQAPTPFILDLICCTSSTHQIYKSCNIHVYVSPIESACSQSSLFAKALFGRVIWEMIGLQPTGPDSKSF
jgi:hypothetical protein